jgi:hypothetical protein
VLLGDEDLPPLSQFFLSFRHCHCITSLWYGSTRRYHTHLLLLAPEPFGGAGNRCSWLFVFSIKLSIACRGRQEKSMHQIIYLVGLIVVIMFVLSVLGLR